MCSLISLISTVIDLYTWAIIIAVVMSWLVQFNVINSRSRVVYVIGDFLARLTEPALQPIRNVMPNLGGIDVSPIVLLLLLIFVQSLLWETLGAGCTARF